MKFFAKHNTLFRVLAVVFVVLYALLQTGTVIAMENKQLINDYLKVRDYEVVETGDGTADTDYYKSDYKNLATLMADGQTKAEEVMAEGAVLVKNDNNALPLAKGAYVGLFGYASVESAYVGSGSAEPDNPMPAVNLLDGCTKAGLKVDEVVYNHYKDNATQYAPVKYNTKDASWDQLNADGDVAASLAKHHDAAIFVVRRSRGENDDPTYSYLQLSDKEKSVLAGLKSLKGTSFDRIIVLFNTPNQVEADFLADEQYGVDAALWIGTVGQTGMTAVGKILVGDVNPSGRLSDMWWTKHSYNPAMANFGSMRYANADDFADLPEEGSSSYTSMTYTAYVSYTEGIYVGYRYAETRYTDKVRGQGNAGDFNYADVVAYPFGYGLSYTQFSYDKFTCQYNTERDKYTVTVNVTNVGSKPGKEVVQLYLSKPYTEYDIANGVEKAAVELVAFGKTDVLGAGESQTITLTVDGRDLASYDSNKAKTYITEAGSYYFTVAANAHEAANNVLAKQGYKAVDGMTAAGNAKLVVEHDHGNRTYNKSAATGATITNLFDGADYNKASDNDKGVTYVSRNDWTGTLPKTMSDHTVLYLTEQMVLDMLSMRTSESVQSDDSEQPELGVEQKYTLVELRTDAEGNTIAMDSELWDELVDQLTWDDLCMLLGNGLRRTMSAKSVSKPATVEHNGPTGVTERYDFGESGLANKTNDPDKQYSPTYYPSVGILAATFNQTLAEQVGTMYGEDALWAGYSGLYGIGLNIHRTAFDGRSFEYYSEDPVLSGVMAANLVKGLQSKGCNGYVKHLVAYEQQAHRVGLAVWANEQTLREVYLKPFQIAVVDGGAVNAMAAYTRLGVTYCAGNKALLTDFLRGECGMKGFVVSDMWDKRYDDKQFVAFLMAGCDLPDGDRVDVSQNKNLFDEYASYGNVVTRMKQAAKRILYATAHSNAVNGLSATKRFVPVTVGWQVALNAGCWVLGVLAALSLAGLVLGQALVIKKRIRINKFE